MLKKLKELFKKDTKWKTLYEETRKESMKWEFKFNKLNRQLKAIIKESDA